MQTLTDTPRQSLPVTKDYSASIILWYFSLPFCLYKQRLFWY